MPARLIEVRHQDETLMVRLQTTISPDDRYIALGYCWGKVQGQLKLLLQNLTSSNDGFPRIPFLKLSETLSLLPIHLVFDIYG